MTQHRPNPLPRGLLYAVMLGLFIIWSNSFHAIAYFRTRLAVSTTALVTLRYGFAAIFCVPYCLIRWREVRQLLARDGWRVVAMGSLMVSGYNFALNWAQGRVPPATASLIITMNPVFTFLLAVPFLGERASWMKILGLGVAFLGVYGLVHTQQRSFGSGYELYALVLLLAPLSWALATVLGKPITGRCDPLLLTFTATGIGSLPFLITLLAGTGGVHPLLRHLSWVGWAALLHLAVLCTIIGFAVWFWALRHTAASSVAAFVFLNPPLTSIFGALWRTESFHWSTALFGAIILGGVALGSGIWNRAPIMPAD